jgi:acyl dehydratase
MIQLNQVYRHEFNFSQAEVVKFAEVTGDHNPIHLDAEYAKNTVFKQPIMHGFLGGSVFSKVFGTLFPGEGSVYLRQSMEFLRPMLAGQTYEAVFTVKEINAEKHRAVIETIIYDKTTQKATLKGEAEIMNSLQIV